MTAFPQLSDVDVDNILAYTSQPKEVKPKSVAGVGGAGAKAGDAMGISNNLVLGLLAVILADFGWDVVNGK